MGFIIESKYNESCLASAKLYETVSLFHYLLALIIWCNESLFLIILNSLFTDSLHFPSVFTHGFIQLFLNVMNRIKIINQEWIGLMFVYKHTETTEYVQN